MDAGLGSRHLVGKTLKASTMRFTNTFSCNNQNVLAQNVLILQVCVCVCVCTRPMVIFSWKKAHGPKNHLGLFGCEFRVYKSINITEFIQNRIYF